MQHFMQAPGVVVLGLSQLPCGMWDLPRPGIKLVIPALTGRFLTTGPPQQSNILLFFKSLFYLLILAALGLCCCVQAFSSFGELGLLSSCGVGASHCGGFSCGSRVQAQ